MLCSWILSPILLTAYLRLQHSVRDVVLLDLSHCLSHNPATLDVVDYVLMPTELYMKHADRSWLTNIIKSIMQIPSSHL